MDESNVMSLSGVELLDYIQVRYPYLMMDKIKELVPGKYAIGVKNLSQNEWFFPVHFIGDPCMPGFLQAEALTQVCALTIQAMPENKGKIALLLSCDNLKLYRKVRPGDIMELKTELVSYRHGIAKGRGKAFVDDKVVCSCEMTFTLSDSEERKSLTPKV